MRLGVEQAFLEHEVIKHISAHVDYVLHPRQVPRQEESCDLVSEAQALDAAEVTYKAQMRGREMNDRPK